MLMPDPTFRFRPRHSLTQWYGHVHLLDDRVVGQWFCLNRATGQCQWERTHARPNTFVGAAEGVIIASEMRSDGPWTATFGCYALSLDTGDLLWVSHAEGFAGRLLRALDFVPYFTNDLRDSANAVIGHECICNSGRVLDVRTGKLLRRISKSEFDRLTAQPGTQAEAFYNSVYSPNLVRIRLNEGWLSYVRPPAGKQPDHDFRACLTRDDGTEIWTFDLASLGLHMSHTNFYSFRLDRPVMYVFASEEPTLVRREGVLLDLQPNPAIYHLLTIELASGRVVQDIRIAQRKFTFCRIEDIDDAGLLVANSEHELLHFAKRS